MAETITLSTPITHPNVTGFTIDQININRTAGSIYITWFGNTGELFSASYPTPSPNAQPSGATLLHSLNNGNFSANSLVKQIFTRLQTDGYIAAGTISGSPD